MVRRVQGDAVDVAPLDGQPLPGALEVLVSGGFLRVVRLTQTDQVGAIVVARVVVDVVDLAGRRVAPHALTLRANGLLAQHQVPKVAPCLAIKRQRPSVGLLLLLQRPARQHLDSWPQLLDAGLEGLEFVTFDCGWH